jgi:hypothetical protein
MRSLDLIGCLTLGRRTSVRIEPCIVCHSQHHLLPAASSGEQLCQLLSILPSREHLLAAKFALFGKLLVGYGAGKLAATCRSSWPKALRVPVHPERRS